MLNVEIRALRVSDVIEKLNISRSQWYNLLNPEYCQKYNHIQAPPPRYSGIRPYWLNIEIDSWLLQEDQGHIQRQLSIK